MVTIINATPHDVVILKRDAVFRQKSTMTYYLCKGRLEDEDVVKRFPKSPDVLARCVLINQNGTTDGDLDTLTDDYIDQVSKSAVQGLPDQQPGVYYITSVMVKLVGDAAGRTDLLTPLFTVRDSYGSVQGCLKLDASTELSQEDVDAITRTINSQDEE